MAEREVSSDFDNENKLLQVEAQAALKEIRFTVNDAEISQVLPISKETVYLNLTTKEVQSFCVELSVQGFRIVGKAYDKIEESSKSQYYETIYALLDQVSPNYRLSFGEALIGKLETLQQQETS